MLQQYRTVQKAGEAELEIHKSRFITYVQRVADETDAINFITQIKKKHWDATHNCSAYVIGELGQWQKADDDGEPAGTAGKPILEVLKRLEIKDVVVIVTRYFGGIKLGAGGLIRAYGKCAKLGLNTAGLAERVPHRQVTIEIEYTLLGKVENELRTATYIIEDITYVDRVYVKLLVATGQEEDFSAKLLEWTAGQAKIEFLTEQYVDIPLSDRALE